MRMDYEADEGTVGQRRSLLSLLLLPLLAFLLGLAAMAWLITRSGSAAGLLGLAPEQAVQPAAPTPTVAVETAPEPAPAAKAPQEPERLLIDPETTRRVNRLEERIAQIDNQSRAAVGNADRAEGLLVAFAARRALDRGVALGYIEGLLRQRFGETQRAAVATILTAARQPVTLGELREELQDVAPKLVGSADRDWWTAFRAELGSMITIRKKGTPSTLPSERLRRAEQRLDAGQVEVALAEVLRMPGRQNAGEWVAKARRYVGARAALDTIETAALLEPRTPTQIQAGAPAAR